MATSTKAKGQVVALAKQLIAGTTKRLAKGTQVSLVGSSFTPDQITTELQSIVNLRTDVDAAKATAKAKLAAETAQMPALRTFMSAYVSFIKAAYGTSPDALADFGINPKARAQLTVEAKTAAAAKRKATRAARHTMGSKQKLGVKGDVTGITVTPITAPQPIVAGPGTAPSSPGAPATSTGTTAATVTHTA
jgi:hypothetical protein